MNVCPACKVRYAPEVSVCATDGERLVPEEMLSTRDDDLPPGFVIKDYRVEKKIGEGGFGTVYRAVHTLIGKPAAVKVLSLQYSTNPEMVSRFISEASVVNEIRHGNIIDVFDFGKLPDGRQCFFMELLVGKPLDEVLRERGRFQISEVVPILKGVARALDAAHARGVAHRDLKPENVFISFDEEGVPKPKLLDFGIAKLLSTSAASKTRTGTPMGTPLYMSPEQCRGVNVDTKTDIYSFGIMVHELLVGAPPFDGQTMMDILFKQTSAMPPTMSSMNSAVPVELDAPVLHMLEKDPLRRPPSVGAALAELLEAAKAIVDMRTSTLDIASASGNYPAFAAGAAPRTTRGSAAATPDFVNGKTVAAVTPSGASSSFEQPPPEKTKSKMPLVLAGVIGVAVLGLAGFALAPKGTNGDRAGAGTGATSMPTVTGEPTKTVPTATTSNVPTVDAEVEVVFATKPEGADVLLEGKKIGTTDVPLRLKRDKGPFALVLRLKGYKPIDVTIDERQNLSSAKSIPLSFAFEKVKAAGSGHNINKDIPTSGYP